MTLRVLRRAVLLGLGVIAGAVLPDRIAAQVPVKRDTSVVRRDTMPSRVDSARAKEVRAPQRPDTITVKTPARADTMLKNDSIALGVVPLPKTDADTLKPPLARSEAPLVLDIGAPRVYDRAALFATGALTLGDLLSRVPGLTRFAAGWLAAPAVVASQGDLRRIRVFLDGVELDPMDQRDQGVSPVNALPLYALEELRIERGADEVRVYGQSWRVDRTTAYTRADVALGDENTTFYRAFFGRRFNHGEALQVAAEQYNMQPDRNLTSSDGQHLMARLGLVRGPWRLDGFADRADAHRGKWVGVGNRAETLDTIPGLESRRTTAYVRLGNGDPEGPRWLQLIASSHAYRAAPIVSTGATTSTPSGANSDSTTYESQYLTTGGITAGPARASVAERIRVGNHVVSASPSVRAALQGAGMAVSLLGEGKSVLDPARLEVTGRIVALERLALNASVSHTGEGTFDRVMGQDRANAIVDPQGGIIRRPPDIFGGPYDSTLASRYQLGARTSTRAEAGVKLRDLWVSAGLLHRDATTLLPPAGFDTSYSRYPAVRTEGAATATTVAVRGRLFRAVNVDAWAVAWGDSLGYFRPRYQTRSELYIQTNLLDRFPRGNFGLLASLAHEYRSSARFPVNADSVRTAPGFRTLDFKLEIRIQTATISYQFRNLLQQDYQEIPGYPMPRQWQFYGVRWDFWN